MYALILLTLSTIFSKSMIEKPCKILFFGDSITEQGVQKGGYIDILNQQLIKKKQTGRFELIGSGIGGNKVYDLFFRLENDVIRQSPDIAVIWIGINDVWHKQTHGTGTDFDKFALFYNEIIQKFKKEGIKVICCTPGCIGEKTDFSNAQDGDLNELSKIIKKIASNNQAMVIDIRQAFLEYNLIHNKTNTSYGFLTNDGVHLNDKGNQLVADLIWKQIIE